MSEAPNFVLNQQDTTIPRFYIKAVQNNFRTEREGRPIFDDLEYVEIIIPGDLHSVVDRRVREDDRRRWPQHYAAFKAMEEFKGDGTPLIEWPQLTRSQVEELKHFRVFTVEALANLSDELLARVVPIGGRSMRDQARAFLDTAAGAAPTARLIAEGEAKDHEIAVLKEKLAAAEAAIADLKRSKTDGAN